MRFTDKVRAKLLGGKHRDSKPESLDEKTPGTLDTKTPGTLDTETPGTLDPKTPETSDSKAPETHDTEKGPKLPENIVKSIKEFAIGSKKSHGIDRNGLEDLPMPPESTNHRWTADEENDSHTPSSSKAVEAEKPPSENSDAGEGTVVSKDETCGENQSEEWLEELCEKKFKP
ncbi:MAG: hypothetical protein Q9186_007625 [Xanthomendoza sp. 1 TL-2023]